MSNPKRIRAAFINSDAVQHYANKLEIYTYEKFEVHLFKQNKKLQPGSKLAKKAWYGNNKVQFKDLEIIAKSLNLTDYQYLLDKTKFDKNWQTLLATAENPNTFLHLVPHDTEDLNIVAFDRSEKQNLPQIPMKSPWHIDIIGNTGEEFLLIFQSETQFFQLAPVDDFKTGHKITSKITRYPPKSNLTFTASEGPGWRKLIAIKGHMLPTTSKNQVTGYSCSADELDILARKLLTRDDNTIAIATYEFTLIP